MEIFTSKGSLRPADSYTEAELAELSPERLARFNELRAAAADLETAEADLHEAQLSVERWVKTRAEAIAELNRIRPPRTFMQEWSDMRASNR